MDDETPGVPEWVVTYGDMMSLLLTFFIMLVSLSDVKADAKYRAILESLQKYTGYRTSPITPPGKELSVELDDFADANARFVPGQKGQKEESGRRQKPVRCREARSRLSHTRRNGVEGRRTGDFRSQ
jgi:chemotaxis protein MotB